MRIWVWVKGWMPISLQPIKLVSYSAGNLTTVRLIQYPTKGLNCSNVKCEIVFGFGQSKAVLGSYIFTCCKREVNSLDHASSVKYKSILLQSSPPTHSDWLSGWLRHFGLGSSKVIFIFIFSIIFVLFSNGTAEQKV